MLVFALRYLAIGAFFVSGGMMVLLGTQAFQTMSPATPTATGTTLASNNSTGTYLAMRGRAPCSSGTAIVYEDKCLDLMTWTAANRTACFAKKWGGWIDVNPEHLNAVNWSNNLVWSYYGNTSAAARYGFKFWWTALYVNGAGTTANYISTYQNLGQTLWNPANAPTYALYSAPTTLQTVSPIIDNTATSSDNTWVSFICAYFRDPGN